VTDDVPTAPLVHQARRLGDLVDGHPENVTEVVPRLVAILTTTGDPQVVRATVEALGAAWHPTAAAALLTHVARDHPDAGVRLALTQALPGGSTDDDDLRDDAVDALVHLTGDPESPVRNWAAFGLGQLGAHSPPARDALANLLDDPDPETRCEALAALAVAGDARALPALLQRLDSGDDLSLLDLEAAAALAAPQLHPALLLLAEEWAGDQDDVTDVLVIALARCDPGAAGVARQVEQDVAARVCHLLAPTARVRLEGNYPRTVLTVTGDEPGDDLRLPLWDHHERPDRYRVADVVNTALDPLRRPRPE
jgi:hypothetical protein